MSSESAGQEPRHGRRIAALTIGASVITVPLVVFVLGPHLPPGNGSDQAAGQVRDNTVLTAVLTPVICLVLVYVGYALVVFRQHGPAIEEGAAIRGNPRVQTIWIVATSAIVFFLAGYGTWALLETGAGGAQGPTPLVVPKGPTLPVQVIAQQWQFTYRYPTYHGLESFQLVLPENEQVEFEVTSLDVIHSFWAYGLGVKADANPGINNIAYVKTRGPQTFQIQCAELCGLWHGYMFDTGRVVSAGAFASWIKGEQQIFTAVAPYMPPYGPSYTPQPPRRAG